MIQVRYPGPRRRSVVADPSDISTSPAGEASGRWIRGLASTDDRGTSIPGYRTRRTFPNNVPTNPKPVNPMTAPYINLEPVPIRGSSTDSVGFFGL